MSIGSASNSFFNDSHFSTNYSVDSADRIFGVPARTIDDDFEVDSRLSLGAFDVSGHSVNPYGKVGETTLNTYSEVQISVVKGCVRAVLIHAI